MQDIARIEEREAHISGGDLRCVFRLIYSKDEGYRWFVRRKGKQQPLTPVPYKTAVMLYDMASRKGYVGFTKDTEWECTRVPDTAHLPQLQLQRIADRLAYG